MGLDFSLDEQQLPLRAGARQFADGVLTGVAAALKDIPGPEERFYAIAGIMQDVLCFPVYDGGNMGVRRRQLHEMFQNSTYDPLGPAENRLSTA